MVRGAGGDHLSPYWVYYDGGSTAPSWAGTHAVRVQYYGDYNYEAVTVDTLVISKATPFMSALSNSTITYDGQPHWVTVTVQGVDYSTLTPVVVTYNGSTTRPVDAGSYALEARYDGSINYNAISKTATMTILQASPAIAWAAPAPITYGTSLGGPQLNATASVPGTFAYTPDAGAIPSAGPQTLTTTFTPTDAVNYQTKTASVSLTVSKADAVVTWNPPADIVHGTALDAAQLNATANVPGTFTYSPAAGSVLAADAQTLSVTFAPDDAANYAGATATTTLNVAKASTTIAWAAPGDIVYGTALGDAQLNATANVAGTFTYSPVASTVLAAGTRTLSTTFTPDDTANYIGATATTTIDVTKAPSTLTWVPPADIVYGTALGATQLNATASVPGTFSYSPAAGTVLGAGGHTLTVTFTPEDAGNHASATAATTVTVTKAPTTITWTAPGDIVYGTALSATQLHATADVPGTFIYSPPAGTLLSAGARTLSVTFESDDLANYAVATASATLNVARAPATITWAAPANIVYGTALSASQLNATADVPGTFVYSPAAATMLPAGTHTLSVTFTPDDAANYTGTSTTRSLTVVKSALTVTANNASKPYGAPLPAFSASTSGFVNGESLASLTGSLTFATSATATSAIGTYPVMPQGVSSPNYTITFAAGTLAIMKASTATSASASPQPVGLNQPVTLTATVSVGAPGAGAMSGDVRFYDGGLLLGTVPLANGSASLTTNGMAAGNHSISATYSGDGSFVTSTGTTTLTVNASAASSSTTVASSLNPANAGQSVTFTATITAAGTVTGNVQF
ncbi:MAG TPA: Ig-like domain repeat protein, partial [Vicinamibacterales bacterium]